MKLVFRHLANSVRVCILLMVFFPFSGMAQNMVSANHGLPYAVGGMAFDQSKFQTPAKTLSVRYWHSSKVIITLDRAVPYVYGILSKLSGQQRIYLDLFDTTLTTQLQQPVESQASQNSPKIYQLNPRIVRFEMMVNGLSSVVAMDYDAVGQRQIILEARFLQSSSKKKDSPDKRAIIIDAGHGGEALGAVANGLEEHAIVLQAALFLQKELKALTKIPVLLTRQTNKTMSIDERLAFADKHHGSLLISIHANAYRDPKVRGTEVYFLNSTEDQSVSNLASRENEMSLAELQKFQKILTDLKLGTHIARSEKLAKSVHFHLIKSLKKRYTTRDMGVKQAPFLILFANIPAILVELEFLTNPQAAKLLTSQTYLQTTAQGIAKGVMTFLNK